MDLRGYEFYKVSGAPVSGALAEIWDAVDGTPGGSPITNVTTTSNGQWEFLGVTDTPKDIRVTFTGSIRWYKGLTKSDMTKLLVGSGGLRSVGNAQIDGTLGVTGATTVGALTASTSITASAVLVVPTKAAVVTTAEVGLTAAGGSLWYGDGTVSRTLVSLNQTQTLTNKTLTGPTLDDPFIGIAAGVDFYPYAGTSTQTLPTPSGNAGRMRHYKAYGGSLVVNSNAGSQQVNPGGTAATSTLTLLNGDSATFYCDGSLWFAD